MDKHLHENLSYKTGSTQPSDAPILPEQVRMDDEFAQELLALKAVKLEPRKEAVEKLFELMARQSVAEHH